MAGSSVLTANSVITPFDADLTTQNYDIGEVMGTHPCNEETHCYVIYSANEASVGDGAGFWSNDDGWVEEECATRFTEREKATLHLPMSTGGDAHWRLIDGQNGQ